MMVFWFFFFQAEDGIRDGRVTGVQTCALPICRLTRSWVPESPSDLPPLCRCPPWRFGHPASREPADGADGEPAGLGERRSEERRVGKECRSRGSLGQ